MHVGTGERANLIGFAAMADDPDPPQYATLVRDVDCKPYLPGTTLKGLLRRVAESEVAEQRLDADVLTSLFGAIAPDGTSEGTVVGALSVRGASHTSGGDSAGMPYAGRVADGAFIAARTRIDRHAGTAADNKLFFQEMVAPGARYRLSLILEGRATRGKPAWLPGLLKVLHALTDRDGWAIGKGQADGQGRIRLDPDSVSVATISVGTTGELISDVVRHHFDATIGARAAAVTEARFVLDCPGPFLVVDSSHVPARDAEGDPVGPQVKAQEAAGAPMLSGSSVTGVLRARAAWLEALRHGGAMAAAEIDDPDKTFLAGMTLTAVERLFGISGFRGLLEVMELSVSKASKIDLTSVRLDRFSGAPIDNALFTTSAFVGTRLTLRLGLRGRGGTAPYPAERELFERLIADLRGNGMVLGHGGNVGFGWFSVTESGDAD